MVLITCIMLYGHHHIHFYFFITSDWNSVPTKHYLSRGAFPSCWTSSLDEATVYAFLFPPKLFWRFTLTLLAFLTDAKSLWSVLAWFSPLVGGQKHLLRKQSVLGSILGNHLGRRKCLEVTDPSFSAGSNAAQQVMVRFSFLVTGRDPGEV